VHAATLSQTLRLDDTGLVTSLQQTSPDQGICEAKPLMKRDGVAMPTPGEASGRNREPIKMTFPSELPDLTPEVARILLQILERLTQDKDIEDGPCQPPHDQ
jgi:hypothetical protein